MNKINLSGKFDLIDGYWQPKVVAALNGQLVKLAKLKGEFVWHHHAAEDELFLVIAGRLRIEFREGAVELNPGELVVVPAGVEHRPVAQEEVHVLLLEPSGTLNTGNVRDERTLNAPEWI